MLLEDLPIACLKSMVMIVTTEHCDQAVESPYAKNYFGLGWEAWNEFQKKSGSFSFIILVFWVFLKALHSDDRYRVLLLVFLK